MRAPLQTSTDRLLSVKSGTPTHSRRSVSYKGSITYEERFVKRGKLLDRKRAAFRLPRLEFVQPAQQIFEISGFFVDNDRAFCYNENADIQP